MSHESTARHGQVRKQLSVSTTFTTGNRERGYLETRRWTKSRLQRRSGRRGIMQGIPRVDSNVPQSVKMPQRKNETAGFAFWQTSSEALLRRWESKQRPSSREWPQSFHSTIAGSFDPSFSRLAWSAFRACLTQPHDAVDGLSESQTEP